MTHASEDSDPGTPRLRASNEDRDQTVARLQDGLAQGQLTVEEFDERTKLAYGARFRDELAPLLRDLDAAPPAPRAPAPPPATRAPRLGGSVARSQVTGETGGARVSVGLLGAAVYDGTWQIAESHASISLMGYSELNLIDARLPAQEITITALTWMGSVVIYVPEDFRVISEGVGVLGAFSVEDDDGVTLRQADVPSDAPVIRIRGGALMGAVLIYRAPRP